MKNKIEILSPAKNMDAVTAAVRSGADAVYLGGKNFSARMSADNFTIDELKECVKYCHSRNVSVYLTVNTLILDDEFEDALYFIKDAADADIDAVIIQDIGLAYAVHKMIPNLRLHASTQMSIHTPLGVKALYELGFKRVVLSRELSRDEIRKIHNACPEMELEVFVHGALCMCVSGQCYFSAMLGGRSANRGMCAQTCRLPFSVSSKGTNALSLKDNSVIEYLDDLYDIGVTSAKIEGRMKRPEYVAAATKACYEIKNRGKMSEKTKRHLDSVFSRTGFTDGYYKGRLGRNMFGYRQKEDVISATGDLLKEIRSEYKDEKQSISVSLNFKGKLGEYPVLECEGIEVKGNTVCEKAINVPLTYEKIEKSFKKSGGTQFYIEKIFIDVDDNISCPVSELNSMRRDLLTQLSKKREKRHEYLLKKSPKEILKILDETKQEQKNHDEKKYVICTDLLFPNEFKEADLIFADIFAFSDENRIKDLIKNGFKLAAEIPRVMFSNEAYICERLVKLKELGINDVLCHNLSAVYAAKNAGMTVHGSFSLNVFNSFSILFCKEYGINDIEASIELSMEQFNGLKKFIPTGMAVYGYLPVMITRNCPGKGAEIECKSCKKNLFLQDRYYKKFKVLCRNYYCEILNSVPLILSKKIYKKVIPDFITFRFYVENSVEKVEKFTLKTLDKSEFNNFTRGLSTKGVKKLTYF